KGRCQLHAYVPLAELFGYTSELRNFTSGTASFSMEPSHYAPVKEELADLRVAGEGPSRLRFALGVSPLSPRPQANASGNGEVLKSFLAAGPDGRVASS